MRRSKKGNNNETRALGEKKYSLTSLMLSKQTQVYGGTALCSPPGPEADTYCSFSSAVNNTEASTLPRALRFGSTGSHGGNAAFTGAADSHPPQVSQTSATELPAPFILSVSRVVISEYKNANMHPGKLAKEYPHVHAWVLPLKYNYLLFLFIILKQLHPKGILGKKKGSFLHFTFQSGYCGTSESGTTRETKTASCLLRAAGQ